MTTRIALIGNSFASKVQLPALRWADANGAPNRVVALAGHDRDKARRTASDWDIPRATDRWQEVLQEDPDLVVITTPVDLHAPMVRAALKTRAAILCEKPFAMNAEEAAELQQAASGRLALLDHQLRWSPWRRRLGALLREGRIGEPLFAETRLHIHSPARLKAPFTWWYDASRGGGALGAIGSHLLDALQVDLGPVSAVRARLETYVKERKDSGGQTRTATADEHATLWLRMQSGLSATLDTNLLAPPGSGSGVIVQGSEGTLWLERETQLYFAKPGEEFVEEEVLADHVPSMTELGIQAGGIFARLLPLYLRDVVRAAGQGAASLDGAATFADGRATMAVLDAARRSAAGESWEAVGA